MKNYWTHTGVWVNTWPKIRKINCCLKHKKAFKVRNDPKTDQKLTILEVLAS